MRSPVFVRPPIEPDVASQHRIPDSKIARSHICNYAISTTRIDILPTTGLPASSGRKTVNDLIEICRIFCPHIPVLCLSSKALLVLTLQLRHLSRARNVARTLCRVRRFRICHASPLPYTNPSPSKMTEKSLISIVSVREGMCQNGHWSGAPCMAHPLHNALGYWRSSARFLVRWVGHDGHLPSLTLSRGRAADQTGQRSGHAHQGQKKH